MRAVLAPFFAALMGFAGLCAAVGPAHARDQVPAEIRDLPWTGVVPTCESQSVLADISSGFARKESLYWNSDLTIAEFDRIGPIGVRPWALDYIPRRFCAARVRISNGQWHNVYYSVREQLGPIGITWDVNWCVTGFDRDLAYAPNCQMARP
jgi:hypothetical protein